MHMQNIHKPLFDWLLVAKEIGYAFKKVLIYSLKIYLDWQSP
jgi:hypothetical protein